jgi:hypothetical protein
MITDNKSQMHSPNCSQPTDQEMDLLDQVTWVAYGFPNTEVLMVAATLMTHAVVAMSPNREIAWRALDAAYLKMAEHVDDNFENIKAQSLGTLDA